MKLKRGERKIKRKEKETLICELTRNKKKQRKIDVEKRKRERNRIKHTKPYIRALTLETFFA